MILSICIPTYNRCAEMEKLLQSIPQSVRSDIEICVFDDGSNDGTRALIESQDSFDIRYAYLPNRGRAHALRDAILMANGKYSLLMDSDDYFLEGALQTLLNLLRSRKYPAYIFAVESNKGRHSINPCVKTFIQHRLCQKKWLDLKEVVLTNELKSVLYNYGPNIRRVPTSMLWHRLSGLECLSVNEPLIYKNYLEGGLTKNIRKIKSENLAPIQDYYRELVNSHFVDDHLFKLKASIKLGFYDGRADGVNYFQRIFVYIGRLIRKCI